MVTAKWSSSELPNKPYLMFSMYLSIYPMYSYNILIIIVTYCLPIVSMTVTYSRVGIELWGSKTIGEYTPRQVENVRSKRRVSLGGGMGVEVRSNRAKLRRSVHINVAFGAQPQNVCYGLFLTFSSFSQFWGWSINTLIYIDTNKQFAWAGRIFKILIFRLGGQDDDCCCTNIRRLLATLPHVLHRDLLLPRHHGGAIHSGTVFGYLLAGNEQFHVQSDYILLDEFTVSSIFPESVCRFPFPTFSSWGPFGALGRC